MRIVIDMQGAQTGSRFRGIGSYTVGLARAIVRNRGDDQVFLAVSGFEPDSVLALRREFSGLLPRDHIVVCCAPGHPNWIDPNGEEDRAVAAAILEEFIKSLRPDVVLISSLFEGFADNTLFAPDGLHRSGIPYAAIDYDLIPYLNQTEYLNSEPGRNWYMERFHALLSADRIFSISESSRRELLSHTETSPEKVVNISCDAAPLFSEMEVNETVRGWLKELGISRDFVLYTGGAEKRKNIASLVQAYAALSAPLRREHQLVIVCGAQKDQAEALRKLAQHFGLRDDEVVTLGYISAERLKTLYNTCKLFVFPSFYEGFGLPVLEAMRCGAPVIASGTTSMPEVLQRDEALFDPADIGSISKKMNQALSDEKFLASLREHARTQCRKFSWDRSAQRCLSELRAVARKGPRGRLLPYPAQIDSICARLGSLPVRPGYNDVALAEALARTFQPGDQRQLFVDVSELAHRDSATGIQRVTRSVLQELCSDPPRGYRVCPVYATSDRPGYFYADKFAARFLGRNPDPAAREAIIDYRRGDFFLGLDLQSSIVPLQQKWLTRLEAHGVPVYFVVYDLLPVFQPEFFRSTILPVHQAWLQVISQFDGACCISRAVAADMERWMTKNGLARKDYDLSWFHLGSDIQNSHPSAGLPDDAAQVLAQLGRRPVFLMVSTVEPRKGHAQAVAAFDLLWQQGVDVTLVIVGREGWNVSALTSRLRSHPELGKRLFWLNGISDEYLEKVYAAATVVLMASEGEGFGLAVVEGARHRKPLILRDLPVFREIAGDSAFYFSGRQAEDLAGAITRWLSLYAGGKQPSSDGVECLTWKQSTRMLLSRLPLSGD